jgi:hypothetical protein
MEVVFPLIPRRTARPSRLAIILLRSPDGKEPGEALLPPQQTAEEQWKNRDRSRP